jgi:DNA-binding XRE family transcriptional regulator
MEAPDKKPEDAKPGTPGGVPRAKKVKNNVRKLRMERMISKAELARRAGLSTLTVDRVERGMSSRMDTKRKILEALGLKPTDRVMVFGDSEED